MSLGFRDKCLLRARSLEFQLPISVERKAIAFSSSLKVNPWLPLEKELGVVFIHVPKSAGTSIVSALFNQKSRHVPVVRYAAHDESLFRSSYKFTFVRNPWSRIHSAYHYLYSRVGRGEDFFDWIWATHYLKDTPSFEEFVLRLKNNKYRNAIKRYIHFRDQLDWISIPGKGQVMDFVGHFESLDDDFNKVCNSLGLSNINLPALRPGSGKDYRKDFTQPMIDVVGDLYIRDIKTFGYSF